MGHPQPRVSHRRVLVLARVLVLDRLLVLARVLVLAHFSTVDVGGQ